MRNIKLGDHSPSIPIEMKIRAIKPPYTIHTVFQPVVNHVDRMIYGLEALTRPSDDSGAIPPQLWFQQAMKNHHAVDAECLASESALGSFKHVSQGEHELSLFINVIPTSLLDRDYCRQFQNMVRETGISPGKIVLELVEYAQYEPKELKDIVDVLRTDGYRIALDDVGQGVSTLKAIVELEPNFLKLDKSLIQGCSLSSSQQRLIKHLVTFMGSGESIIAEGIENLDDFIVVREAGVMLSQGHFWHPPIALNAEAYADLHNRLQRQLFDLIDAKPSSPVAILSDKEKKQAQSGLKRSLGLISTSIRRLVSQDKLNAETPSQQNSSSDTQVVHGRVGVTHGEIIVLDPDADGRYPTLQIPDDPRLEIYVNGMKVAGTIVLSESHDCKVKLLDAKPSVSYTVTPSIDKLSLTLKKTVISGSMLSLKDISPVQHLALKLDERVLHPAPDSVPTLLDRLRDQGYTGRIDYLALGRLCVSETSAEEIVLYGTPPVTNRFPYRFRKMSSSLNPITRQRDLENVSAGTTLATVDQHQTNEPGRDVFGKIIAAEQGPMVCTLGSGIIELDGKLVASTSGKPIVRRTIIDVITENVIEHNVINQRIVKHGNIVIRGNVLRGSHIEATGDVTIHGGVSDATVIGERSVTTIGEIEKSTVQTGKIQQIHNDIVILVCQIQDELETFHNEYRAVVSHAMKRYDAYTVIPKIPKILLQKRHGELAQHLKALVNLSFDLSEPSHGNTSQLIKDKWIEPGISSLTEHDIVYLKSHMKQYLLDVQPTTGRTSFIRTHSVFTSALQASGNIIVTGDGSFSSTLESGNTVSVYEAVCGGFVVARKSVYIGELGAQRIVESSVRVTDENGFARIKVCHPNTMVEVGSKRHRFYNTERDLRIRGTV